MPFARPGYAVPLSPKAMLTALKAPFGACQRQRVVYPHKDPASTIDVFRDRLALHDISTTETAILARGHAIIEQLKPCPRRSSHATR